MSSSNKIFKKGSTTYYNSTKFFPPKMAKEVTSLYAFVRVVDDFVDSNPPFKEEFFEFKREFYNTLKDRKNSKNEVILDFVDLFHEKKFDLEWVDSFFYSMELDLTKKKYKTFNETKEYIYGSAEVIGLMMSKIMNLPEESYSYAQSLGCAMQYINMIRDVNEDLSLGRIYLPTEKIEGFKLSPDFSKNKNFQLFIKSEIERYFEIQKHAEKGFKYIPHKYLIPIKTASDMYKWTAHKIYKNPEIIFKKKVKPLKLRVLIYGLKNKIRK